MKTALTMLPATIGIVAGNGMPLAPKLGRGLPMIGLALLLAGSVSMIAVVTNLGAGLTPWQLAVPVVLYGAGLGLGASSLMLITLSATGEADAGAASGVVNTVVQLGVAAGPATIGTVFFGRLAQGGDFVDATRISLVLGAALFAAALVTCLLLPRAAVPSGRLGQQ